VRHPAEFFIKAMMIQMPTLGDPDILKRLEDWGFLKPLAEEQKFYIQFIRSDLAPGGQNVPPPDFNYSDRLSRSSMRYLREQQVYEYFYPMAAMNEAYDILRTPDKRLLVDQGLLARLPFKILATQLNRKKNWHLTETGVELYKHYFCNVDLLTFDEWGRFLYGRSMLYERQLNLLVASPQLALHILQVEQQVESKQMLKDVQRCAYFTYMEVANKPGTDAAKIKAMGVLAKTVIDSHEALSTSDTVLGDVLKKFEKFRMERPEASPQSMAQLAPRGNFTGSGIKAKDEIVEVEKK
jgi:hypothetical protein